MGSVPSNPNIAQGSLEELRYYLILARDLGYERDTAIQISATEEIGRMLHGLIKAVAR